MDDEPAKLILGDSAISSLESPPRWRRRRDHQPPLTHCENCGAALTGHYCGKCGQAAVDYRRSFRHVIIDVLDSFLNWDSKFFATVAWLIVSPWYLTNEFLGGRRVRYLHPLRLYLLASILFFFFITYCIKQVHVSSDKLPPEARAEIASELKKENLTPAQREKIEKALKLAEVAPEVMANVKEKIEHNQSEIKDKADSAGKTPAAPSPPTEPGATPKPEEQFIQFGPEKPDSAKNDFEKWLQKRAKEKIGEHGTNAQLFFIALIQNFPYMMLCCIPLFAFVLKILYVRKKIFYIDHLVYALHIHTFVYVSVILIVLATIGLNRIAPPVLAGWLIGLLWAAFAVQIFLSIRRVYRQSWFFSIFKFFAGGFVYLIVLCIALAATFFATLALP